MLKSEHIIRLPTSGVIKDCRCEGIVRIVPVATGVGSGRWYFRIDPNPDLNMPRRIYFNIKAKTETGNFLVGPDGRYYWAHYIYPFGHSRRDYNPNTKEKEIVQEAIKLWLGKQR